MAACTSDKKVVQSVVPARGGPFLTRRAAQYALEAAIRLCVSSSAPPCCGDCVARGTPCEAVVDEWDLAIGPFYSAPSGGSGWYYRIPAGSPIVYHHVPATMRAWGGPGGRPALHA